MGYNYSERIKLLMPNIKQAISKERSSFRYQLIASCLRRFIPSLLPSEYVQFLEQVLINQALAYSEQTDTQMLKNCNYITSEPLSTEPRIYVSFHLSSYRLNMLYLLQNGLPITLVASKDVIKEQSSIIKRSYASVSSQTTHNIIDANHPNSIKSMLRELRDGRSIFAFIDGNTGVDGMSTSNKHLMRVPLLESHIMVRTGLAHLSKIANVPIVPMITYRKQNEFPTICLFNSILANSNENTSNYVIRAIRVIYQYLDSALRSYADQYEPWLYMYKFADKISTNTGQKQFCDINYKFNDFRYNAFCHKNIHYLLDNNDFSAIEIDADTYRHLKMNEVDINLINSQYRNYFINQQVVI